MRELQHLQAKTALGSQLCTTVGHQQAKTFLFIDPVKLLVNSTFLFFFSLIPHRSPESKICKTQARKLQNDAYHDVQREFKHCLDPALPGSSSLPKRCHRQPQYQPTPPPGWTPERENPTSTFKKPQVDRLCSPCFSCLWSQVFVAVLYFVSLSHVSVNNRS